MIVEVIQFLRPYGRQVKQEAEVPDELIDKYTQMREAGCRLTAEVLPGGLVSLCIESRELGEDLYLLLANNGPGANSPANVVAKLLEQFDPDYVQTLKQEAQDV